MDPKLDPKKIEMSDQDHYIDDIDLRIENKQDLPTRIFATP